MFVRTPTIENYPNQERTHRKNTDHKYCTTVPTITSNPVSMHSAVRCAPVHREFPIADRRAPLIHQHDLFVIKNSYPAVGREKEILRFSVAPLLYTKSGIQKIILTTSRYAAGNPTTQYYIITTLLLQKS